MSKITHSLVAVKWHCTPAAADQTECRIFFPLISQRIERIARIFLLSDL